MLMECPYYCSLAVHRLEVWSAIGNSSVETDQHYHRDSLMDDNMLADGCMGRVEEHWSNWPTDRNSSYSCLLVGREAGRSTGVGDGIRHSTSKDDGDVASGRLQWERCLLLLLLLSCLNERMIVENKK